MKISFYCILVLGLTASGILGSGSDKHADCPGWAARGDCRLNPGFMLDQCAASCGEAPPGVQEEPECVDWAKTGECSRNPGYMLTFCANACADVSNGQPLDACTDMDQYCSDWADHGECDNNPGYMLPNCPRSCKVCEAPAQNTNELHQDVEQAESKVDADAASCSDMDQYCEAWASHGECDNNPGYMLPNCAKSCNVCQVHAPAQNNNEQPENLGEADADAEVDADAGASEGGTSISALLGNLLPKSEKTKLYKEQNRN